MTVILRRVVGHVYVVCERRSDGKWIIEVSDAMSGEVTEEERRSALEEVLAEISSLRTALWKELGN